MVGIRARAKNAAEESLAKMRLGAAALHLVFLAAAGPTRPSRLSRPFRPSSPFHPQSPLVHKKNEKNTKELQPHLRLNNQKALFRAS
jgi:hypothetical protein